MKKIKLTNGKNTLVDNDDFEKFGKYRWRMDYHGYVIRSQQFGFKGKIKTLLLHREIMGMDREKDKKIDIDHIDGNPLNNKKDNLRKCTRSQNIANSKKRKNNISGYRGVSYCKKYKKWRSEITLNYKKIKLGSFNMKKEAALAYDKKAKELFGEFAKTNF